MKNPKKSLYILIALILLILCIGAFLFLKNGSFNKTTSKEENNTNQYTAEKASTSESEKNENSNNTQSNSNTSDPSNSNTSTNTTNTQEQPSTPQHTETQIATFSTKIYTKDEARQNNMQITASRLNGKIIKNGETFSFCNTLGPSSSKNGYKEADIFDNDGNKKKALGGGNCQISSTLYNAVLSVSSLKIIERHEHSNKVPYVKKGKDAAVAYGSYDFKFQNNSGNDIKLAFNVTADNVTSTIYKLQ